MTIIITILLLSKILLSFTTSVSHYPLFMYTKKLIHTCLRADIYLDGLHTMIDDLLVIVLLWDRYRFILFMKE